MWIFSELTIYGRILSVLGNSSKLLPVSHMASRGNIHILQCCCKPWCLVGSGYLTYFLLTTSLMTRKREDVGSNSVTEGLRSRYEAVDSIPCTAKREVGGGGKEGGRKGMNV